MNFILPHFHRDRFRAIEIELAVVFPPHCSEYCFPDAEWKIAASAFPDCSENSPVSEPMTGNFRFLY